MNANTCREEIPLLRVVQLRQIHPGARIRVHAWISNFPAHPADAQAQVDAPDHFTLPSDLFLFEDGSGCVVGNAFHLNAEKLRRLMRPQVRELVGLVTRAEGHTYLQVEDVRSPLPSRVHSATALLPAHRCPPVVRPALACLDRFEQSLPKTLRRLLRDTLLNPRIGRRILTAPGPRGTCHDFPGGFLVRAMHVHEQTRPGVETPGANPDLLMPLVRLARFLHALREMVKTTASSVPGHRDPAPHRAEPLERHLDCLDLCDPGAARVLRVLLDLLASGSGRRDRLAPRYVATGADQPLRAVAPAERGEVRWRHHVDG